MSFQNISSPRIYLNIPQFLASTGTAVDPVFNTLPVGANSYDGATTIAIPAGILGTKCFVAILGHTLYTDGTDYAVTEAGDGLSSIINGTPASGADGFSISTFSATGTASLSVTGISGNMTVVTGIYHDFVHSPDLK